VYEHTFSLSALEDGVFHSVEPGIVSTVAVDTLADRPDSATGDLERISANQEVSEMKKLINSPETVLADSLAGIAAAHPELRVDPVNRIIYRATPKSAGKVALLSGGGTGHEPLHGGYVGEGMLDAACCGAVFTSPTPDQMLEATMVADQGAGVMHIVKNYTGDVMNFELGAELAAAESGIEVAVVIVNDDVAVEDSSFTAGRRGVGTTVLLEKIAGAAAEQGRDLAAVLAVAEKVNASGRSMGVALTSCTVPSAGKPTFDLPDDEMEIGVGIHGAAACRWQGLPRSRANSLSRSWPIWTSPAPRRS